MTTQRNLKRLIRAHMAETGRRYATARRAVLRELGTDAPTPPADGFVHLPGTHPECASLRVLLANAGVIAPHTGEPPSEDLVFGIAGGVGTGVMAMRYDAEDFSSFWLTGWNPFQSSIAGACERLGLTPAVTETTGARTAAAQLAELLDLGVPAMAWVDAGELGYLGIPELSGMSYHTVVVYRAGTDGCLVGDRAPAPIEIPAERLAAARARIRKQRNRLLSLGPDEVSPDLAAAARRGLAACAAGPTGGPRGSMSVQALPRLAARMTGTGKDGWTTMFPPGRHLHGALRAVVDDTEHQGSGGGLMRPAFARFLREAALLTGTAALDGLAGRYEELGRQWSELAAAALPADVPGLAATRALLAERDELFRRDGAAAAGRLAEIGQELAGLERRPFPLGEGDTRALLAGLAHRVGELADGEAAALGELRDVVARVPVG
jgi:hypothetical protein